MVSPMPSPANPGSPAEPVAAAGIGRGVEHLDENPAVSERRQLSRLDAKILGHRHAVRPPGKHNMARLHDDLALPSQGLLAEALCRRRCPAFVARV
jgi:hypothetical protein